MTIYIRNLKENIIRINARLKISNFFPKGLLTVLKNYIPQGSYVLGVCYSLGDSQICISGHPKVNENNIEGALRELKEELSLICEKKLEKCFEVNENTFYCLDLDNTILDKNTQINNHLDKKERSIICVYGGEKNILHYLATVKFNDLNEDNITSIWSCEKEKLIDYLENRKNQRFLFP